MCFEFFWWKIWFQGPLSLGGYVGKIMSWYCQRFSDPDLRNLTSTAFKKKIAETLRIPRWLFCRWLPSEDVFPLHRWPAFGCWRTNLAPGLFGKQQWHGHRFGFSTGHPFWGWWFLVMFDPDIKWFGWKGDFSNTCRIICWVRTWVTWFCSFMSFCNFCCGCD